MRGPGLKTTLDVRRTWRCPACGYERRADGRLTAIRCQCAASPFMQLVAEPHYRPSGNRPVDVYVDADEILGPPEATPVAVPEAHPELSGADVLIVDAPTTMIPTESDPSAPDGAASDPGPGQSGPATAPLRTPAPEASPRERPGSSRRSRNRRDRGPRPPRTGSEPKPS